MPDRIPNLGSTQTETIALAEKSIKESLPLAEQDSFRPVNHFRAPAKWMNDICGTFYHDGYYHIFYQYSPFVDSPGTWSQLIACWGHARSKDLLHWEHLPIAIAPSYEEGNYQCVSGSTAHNADNIPMLFYGHTPLRENGQGRPRKQRAAMPVDAELTKWETMDIGLAPGENGVPADICHGWTDMYVFSQDGKTFAIFKESNGLVAEAQNPELTSWKIVGKIDGVEGECPNMVRLGDSWALLRSTYPMTYQIGSFDSEKIEFIMDGQSGIVDYTYSLEPLAELDADPQYYKDETGVLVCRYGAPQQHAISRGFYATNAVDAPDGRKILFAWAGAFKEQGWNCCMALPRELSLADDGRLIQKPVAELKQLRGESVSLSNLEVTQELKQINEIAGRNLEVVIDVELNSAESFELLLQDEGSNSPAVKIVCGRDGINANGTIIPTLPGESAEKLSLQLFFDRSLMELFINDGRQCVTRVAYPETQNDLSLQYRSHCGEAKINSLNIWILKPVW